MMMTMMRDDGDGVGDDRVDDDDGDDDDDNGDNEFSREFQYIEYISQKYILENCTGAKYFGDYKENKLKR